MAIISLTTDFGIKDGNVGVMKGVILGICKTAQIVDVSHTIAQQNILEAAYVTGRSWSYFPAGSIHVIVVDPGVGTRRRPIAARVDKHIFVCPDNGSITIPLEQAETRGIPVEIIELDKPRYWLPVISNVFHGRDIFSPCAAHLANGVTFRKLGSTINDPVRLELPRVKITPQGWLGEVIHIDHFGNIATNIRIDQLKDIPNHRIYVKISAKTIEGMVNTFGERPPGELIALIGSTGNLIICAVNGNAASRLGTKFGDEVEVVIGA